MPKVAAGPLEDLLVAIEDAGGGVWLEGGELRYRAPPGVVGPEQIDLLRRQKQLIRGLLVYPPAAHGLPASLSAAAPPARLAATRRQQLLWQAEQGEGPPSAKAVALAFDRAPRPEVLERALAALIRRNCLLRAAFTAHEGRLEQAIAPFALSPLVTADRPENGAADRERAVLETIAALSGRSFDLAVAPLLRAALLRFADGSAVLVLCAHPLIADARALRGLQGALVAVYTDMLAERPIRGQDRRGDYHDYAAWEARWLADSALADHEAFWRAQVDGYAPIVTAPPSPAARYHADTLPIPLSTGAIAALRAAAEAPGVTLADVLTAVFAVAAGRWAGREDIVIDLEQFHRAGTTMVFGNVAHSLPLRVDLTDDPPLKALIRRIARRRMTAESWSALDPLFLQRPAHARLSLVVVPGPVVQPGAPPRAAAKPVRTLALDAAPRVVDFAAGLRWVEGSSGTTVVLDHAPGLMAPKKAGALAAEVAVVVASMMESAAELAESGVF